MRIVNLATLLALLALPLSATAGPRIRFDKETLDYGRVPYGQIVTEEFVVTNEGDQTLVIQSLRSSCGCTKAIKGSSSIAPGRESKIVASFDTNGLRAGRKQQTIFVDSNDPERPTVRLMLLAEIVRDLNVDTPSLAKSLPAYAETVSFTVRITNSSDKPYTVKGVRADPQGVEASLHPVKVLVEANSSATLAIELRIEKDPGRRFYTGRLVLETDHPGEREIEMHYIVKLESTL